MTPDQRSLEAELRDLQAAAFDDAFLTRLEAAAEGTLIMLSPQEVHFEKILRQNRPAHLTPEFMADLERIVSKTAFAINDKIVAFPTSFTKPQARRQGSMWAAAAAVALIGAATALLLPRAENLERRPTRVASNIIQPVAGNFIPASYNRNLQEVHDEGVIWKSKNQPQSLIRVVYIDHVILKDAQGRTFQFDQPRVKYMLVPEKTD